MSRWQIQIRPSRVAVRRPDWHDEVVVLSRDGVTVATVYPTEEQPGIQICSPRLDFTNGVMIETGAARCIAFPIKGEGNGYVR
jgi:hypothetical protein